MSQKRKKELVDLTKKGRDLSLEQILDGEKPEVGVANKLRAKECLLPWPNTLQSDWTTEFSDFPNFKHGIMYTYVINKEGYDDESFNVFKSHQLIWDGRVKTDEKLELI